MLERVILCIIAAILAHHVRADDSEAVHYQPEQVHLAFGDDPLEIVVTWSTFSQTPNSIVEYGIESKNLRAEGNASLFTDGGVEKRSQYIHRVRLTGLQPFTRYVYHCGSDDGWSDEFWFRTVNRSHLWSPRLAIYGDLGNENAVSLPRLQTETQDNRYDAIIHVGDMAYDMDDDNGRVGDEFMKQLEPIAAYVPYMVAPGNHEEAYNFSHFRERFTMPGSHEGLFYSFDLGPIHFISINTEAYYFIKKYGMSPLTEQYKWLKKELKKANKKKNRKTHPWVVVYGHRPMYCSNYEQDVCDGVTTPLTRDGLLGHKYAMETLFHEYKVDLAFWGHEHSYERMWPVYKSQVKKGRRGSSYVNARAPIHVTTGSAGCKELTVNFTLDPQPWSAVRSTHYGYTTLTAYNLTHLHLSQIAVDEDNDVIDDYWIVKEKKR